jgi:predicted CxxxxCH...CXXCH cytochrome family protein
MHPFRCPVCHGNGLVANGFYTQTTYTWTTTAANQEMCRSCSGTGIVWHSGEDVLRSLGRQMDHSFTPEKSPDEIRTFEPEDYPLHPPVGSA